jgi:hypothetical protein
MSAVSRRAGQRRSANFEIKDFAELDGGRKLADFAEENKPADCLCLGRARVGNRRGTVSPYSPCCFQE